MTSFHITATMNDTEIERGFVDCLEDFIDGIMSGDSSFYGK